MLKHAVLVRRALPLLLLAVAACGDTTTTQPSTPFDASALLADVPSKVILPTYVDLEARAGALHAAVVTLDGAVTDDNLAAAQEAWRATRRPWEQSEGFLFGPVETQGIDPGIDSWPVNVADLDAVLASGAALTKAYIDGLDGTLKGFHTIEYLLFGDGSGKTAGDLTPREREYLLAVTESLQGSVGQLRQAWDPAGQNFSATVATAGAAENTVYASQSAALQEIVNGMVAICDEVGNAKISDPFDQQDRALEESQFSDNSNADFADNIRSVQNVYFGQYGSGSGTGVQALVLARNAQADATIQADITAAIAAIEAMTPNFGEAITANAAAVEAARAAVRTLRLDLESDVVPLTTQ